MHIFVGSTNPVKINSVINAGKKIWPDLQVKGIEVPSGVGAQPFSDQETRTGATNRARAVLKAGLKKLNLDNHKIAKNKIVLGIGIEGGIFKKSKNELWSTVWVVVADQRGNIFEANGARFKLPEPINTKLLLGKEMGEVVGALFADPNLKQKQGMIGAVTRGFTNRTEEYTSIVKLALGLYYGQNWLKDLPKIAKT